MEFLKEKRVLALAVFILFLILSFFTKHFIEKFVTKITRRTKTHIDDEIIRISKRPIALLVILAGIWISLSFIDITQRILVKKLFFILIVITVSIYIGKILGILIKEWIKVQAGFEKTPDIISKAIKGIIYLIAGIIILDHLGVKITTLVATLGIGGLALGLALQPTLTNLISGLHIMAERSIRIGDFVEMPEHNINGYVEDISWRSIKIRTLPNQIVIIPNSKFSESIVINNFLPDKEIAVLVQVGVSYESDLEKVEKVTVEVAREIQQKVPGAVKSFEPFIRYHTFGDSNINFTVILRAEEKVASFLIAHEFIKALKKRYDEEGIEISWPIRKIYFAKS